MILYLVEKPLLGCTAVRRFLKLVTRFAQISGVILAHSYLQVVLKSFRFLGFQLAT